MKKFFAYVMKNICHGQHLPESRVQHRRTKIMGAQKARTLVKNHCRHATMSSVFFVRIHVWLRIAIAVVVAPSGALEEGTTGGYWCRLLALESVDITDYEMQAAPMLQTLQGYLAVSTATQTDGVKRSSSGGESSTQRPTSECRVQYSRIRLPSGNILSSSSFASRDTPD